MKRDNAPLHGHTVVLLEKFLEAFIVLVLAVGYVAISLEFGGNAGVITIVWICSLAVFLSKPEQQR